MGTKRTADVRPQQDCHIKPNGSENAFDLFGAEGFDWIYRGGATRW
jgi:hypothetical protein